MGCLHNIGTRKSRPVTCGLSACWSGGQNTGTSGNHRFDNVAVAGDTIINAIINLGAVSAVAAFPLVKIYPNPVSTQLTLQIAATGTKEVTNI